ncbi:hypothetical protein C7I87_20865 [Mesorhizobium sp. SARCC-RB16n]|nr:hypothetical protein C7I87_20865 [Mesorhizobium sp. SARCC-RB16n]
MAATLAAAPAWAQDWGQVANVSTTMGVTGSRLCYGEASRGDIGCPADAPVVSGSTITGTFVGDGSGLTGVTFTTDRIVSGTSAAVIDRNGVLTLAGRLEIVTGTNVVAIGNNAGSTNSGADVVVIGTNAGSTNNSSNVTLVGRSAGYANSGTWVTGVGDYAGQTNTGSALTAVGHAAAQNNIGNNVTALGAWAGTSNTYSNVTLLGYKVYTADKSNQVVLGNGNVVEVSTSGVYVGKGVSITGTVSATSFVGNGSGLTGVSAVTDRLTSGTSVATLTPNGNLTVRGLLDVVTGTSVVAVGSGAGQNNSGSYVTAVGYQAAQYNTTSNTTATGYGAAANNTGFGLTTMGYGAGVINTGNYSVAIGVDAGHYNNGPQLTAVGYDAGSRNSGTQVSAYGYYAGYSNTGSNTTVIGSYAGYQNSGTAVTAMGYQAAQNNTGNNTTAAGYLAGQANSGLYLSALGYGAGQINSGDYATLVGGFAGQNNTQTHLTGVGYFAGKDNTSPFVTAVGEEAGQLNSGYALVAMGVAAGKYNTGSNSTVIGSYAGQYNTGANTAAVGYLAGRNNIGSNVTALGAYAVYTSGVSNTFSNVTGVGYNAQPNKSNQVVLGDGNIVEVSTAGVYVGKGVSTTYVSASLIDATRSGTVSATNGYFTNISGTTINGTFVGDGSGLTGVTAAGSDRIASNTIKVIANGNSNSVSITESGVTTGYYYNGIWVAGGVSTTGAISTTNLYVSGSVGIGTTTPSTTLNIMSASPIIRLSDITGLYSSINGSSGNLYYTSYNSTRNHYFMAGGTELMRILGTGQVGIGTSSPSATLHIYGGAASSTIFLSRAGAPNTVGIIDYSAGAMTIGTNGGDNVLLRTNGLTRLNIDNSGIVTTVGAMGIAMNGKTPSTTLDISGSLKLSNSGETCDTNRTGAIRYVSGAFQGCDGTGWSSFSNTSGTTTTADRITSGTAQVIANGNTNSISITESGVTTGYYYNGIWVAGGVSTTGAVSASTAYINNRLGIGRTPSAALEVSGTVSATVLQLADGPPTICGPSTYGTMKMVNGRPYYCRQ